MKVYEIKFTDADGIDGTTKIPASSLSVAENYFDATFPFGLERTSGNLTINRSQDKFIDAAENSRLQVLAEKGV